MRTINNQGGPLQDTGAASHHQQHHQQQSMQHLITNQHGFGQPIGNPSPMHVQQGPSSDQPTSPRKRRKADAGDDAAQAHAEPRKLRRSHEACSRCRTKKIKCDSKRPKCSACVTANKPCLQEDRYGHQNVARGHTDNLRVALICALALAGRHYPDLNYNNVKARCDQENLTQTLDFNMRITFAGEEEEEDQNNSLNNFHQSAQGQYEQYSAGPSEYMPQPQHLSVYSYGQTNAQISADGGAQRNSLPNTGQGQLTLSGGVPERPFIYRTTNPALWQTRYVKLRTPHRNKTNVLVWWPNHITTESNFQLEPLIKLYFSTLNRHRPVLDKDQFIASVEQLRDSSSTDAVDPGFLCCFGVVVAIGIMVQLHQMNMRDQNGIIGDKPATYEHDGLTVEQRNHKYWPMIQSMFQLTCEVEKELLPSLSAVQAWILIHWFMYAERRGRSLWRMVGTILKLGIEVQLNHHPELPPFRADSFKPDVQSLRLRLWQILLTHDRGTAIIHGRPVSISEEYCAAPRVNNVTYKGDGSCSRHFLDSQEVTEIQERILRELYAPEKENSNMYSLGEVVKKTLALTRSLHQVCVRLWGAGAEMPEMRSKTATVQLDEGLTYLKVTISRMFIMRALLSLVRTDVDMYKKVVADAVKTAHNIIAIHQYLLNTEEIAFFTSPDPLRIAAVMIVYGRHWNCTVLEERQQIQDIWLSYRMLIGLKWTWDHQRTHDDDKALFSQLFSKTYHKELDDIDADESSRLPLTPVTIPRLIVQRELSLISEKTSSPTSLSRYPSAAAGTERGGASVSQRSQHANDGPNSSLIKLEVLMWPSSAAEEEEEDVKAVETPSKERIVKDFEIPELPRDNAGWQPTPMQFAPQMYQGYYQEQGGVWSPAGQLQTSHYPLATENTNVVLRSSLAHSFKIWHPESRTDGKYNATLSDIGQMPRMDFQNAPYPPTAHQGNIHQNMDPGYHSHVPHRNTQT